jgi:purine-binding chemotaxis protein CheW
VAEERQHVIFKLAGQEFGADIAVVKEIVTMSPVTRLPAAPPYVEGVMSLRGTVIPVLSLHKRFGLPDRVDDRESRIMVLDIAGRQTGVIVDGVAEVVKIAEADITEPDAEVTGVDRRYLTGVAKVGDRLVILMDMPAVVGLKAS